jgi:MFS transporter, Spinster family, sphingosine-1-phosphate transporter
VIRDRRAILALLTALNFLNYIDRAVVAAVVGPMTSELALTNFQAGLLNSAFLIGYFATCPWFGARADKGARKRLIALGVAVWSVATVASGLATGFWTLLAARIVVGVGEASFAVLAPTIIDDLTPPSRKGKALAVFYLAIPLGYAMGYLLGGAVAKQWGWRAAFFVAGGPGMLLAISCLAIAEPARKLADASARLIDGLRELAQIPLFRRATVGYCAYTAAVGAFSFWAPTYLIRNFPRELDVASANLWFGVVLLAAGAVGTFLGGFWADAGTRRLPPAPADAPYDDPAHKAVVNLLLRICALGMVVAAPLAALCFLWPSVTGFFALAFLVEVGVFLSTSPINAAFLRAVPVERRASAMAASIFAIHLFGDLWSAAALGLLQDALPLVMAMMALPLTFAGSAAIWWPRRHEAAGPPASTAPRLPHARLRG